MFILFLSLLEFVFAFVIEFILKFVLEFLKLGLIKGSFFSESFCLLSIFGLGKFLLLLFLFPVFLVSILLGDGGFALIAWPNFTFPLFFDSPPPVFKLGFGFILGALPAKSSYVIKKLFSSVFSRYLKF